MVDLNSIKEMIEKNPIALSTVNENNAPHTIYVMYVKIIDKNKLLITDNYMEKTKENIFSNNKVALALAVGEAAFELIGEAEYFSNGEYVDNVKKLPENKGFPCKGAVLVLVEKIVKIG